VYSGGWSQRAWRVQKPAADHTCRKGGVQEHSVVHRWFEQMLFSALKKQYCKSRYGLEMPHVFIAAVAAALGVAVKEKYFVALVVGIPEALIAHHAGIIDLCTTQNERGAPKYPLLLLSKRGSRPPGMSCSSTLSLHAETRACKPAAARSLTVSVSTPLLSPLLRAHVRPPPAAGGSAALLLCPHRPHRRHIYLRSAQTIKHNVNAREKTTLSTPRTFWPRYLNFHTPPPQQHVFSYPLYSSPRLRRIQRNAAGAVAVALGVASVPCQKTTGTLHIPYQHISHSPPHTASVGCRCILIQR